MACHGRLLAAKELGMQIVPVDYQDFANANDEMAVLVASRMGAKQLPVFRTKPMDLAQRKALNIVFNRATNDFDWNSTPEKVTRELAALDVQKLAAAIPDKDVDSPDFIRCLHTNQVSVKALCRANSNRWLQRQI